MSPYEKSSLNFINGYFACKKLSLRICSSALASLGVNASGRLLSRSNTPKSCLFPFQTGKTSSERVELAQAICPSNTSTSGTSWTCPVRAAAPQTPARKRNHQASMPALIRPDFSSTPVPPHGKTPSSQTAHHCCALRKRLWPSTQPCRFHLPPKPQYFCQVLRSQLSPRISLLSCRQTD